MHFILFDGDRRESLLPLTYTRPVADIRTGILTLREKWERRLQRPVGVLTEDYLQKEIPHGLWPGQCAYQRLIAGR